MGFRLGGGMLLSKRKYSTHAYGPCSSTGNHELGYPASPDDFPGVMWSPRMMALGGSCLEQKSLPPCRCAGEGALEQRVT